MAEIRRLPTHLAEKIAAGEVIERPASIVKELTENALDAEATFIKVNIIGGGKKKIQVIDNGCGMTASDLALCVERYATSKIAEEADLFRIQSYGFRGEALPSIGAVSHLTIDSKPQAGDTVEGGRIEVRGSEMLPVRAIGSPVGTVVTVEDLFYNTPARLKFLKSDSVESGRIYDVVLQLALANPTCGFELTVEGKKKLLATPTKNSLIRLQELLRKEWSSDWIPLQETNADLQITGWLSHMRNTQGNSDAVYVYLNGRYLKDRLLLHAVTQGYQTWLMKWQYPVVVLTLKCNPAMVDVNVHPAKREVRFQHSGMVHDFVAAAIRKTLQKVVYGNAAGPAASTFRRPPNMEAAAVGSPASPAAFSNLSAHGELVEPRDAFLKTVPEADSSEPINLFFSNLHPLTQYAQTYLICESPDGALVLIDQHAAHERIGYEQLKMEWQQKRAAVQRLLVPIFWEATSAQIALVAEHQKQFEEAGFEIEIFGDKTLLIKAVPVLLANRNIQQLLEQMVNELGEMTVSRTFLDALNHALATAACHAQVRAGDILTRPEMEHLLKEMDKVQATHCPHGRPTFIIFATNEIEHMFKR